MFLLSLTCSLLAMAVGGVSAIRHKTPFYVGTYTSAHGSQGICISELDLSSGEISKPILAAEASNPSYLAVDPGRGHLYAVQEDSSGSVCAFRIGSDHSLKRVGVQPVAGGSPCHLSVDPSGKNLLVACYTGGLVSCFPIDLGGGLGPASSRIHNTGSGPNHDRQEASHMHWVETKPGTSLVYSCDLGTDKVQVYRLASDRGSLAVQHELQASPSESPLLAGEGPRHGAFSLDGRFLYVNNELGNSVSALAIGPDGSLKLLQILETMPKADLAAESKRHLVTTAEIVLHPNGKWLYVSNRGADSMSQFAILPGGELRRIALTTLSVRMPRGFAIEPSGRWLVVGGQDSDDLASYEINPNTGALREASHETGVGKPVCVLFLKPR